MEHEEEKERKKEIEQIKFFYSNHRGGEGKDNQGKKPEKKYQPKQQK